MSTTVRRRTDPWAAEVRSRRRTPLPIERQAGIPWVFVHEPELEAQHGLALAEQAIIAVMD